ncbi:DUF423 domain-containing protein [Abyssicoccus albus]|uniref:Uncharacterized membrane protein YgdD (TMEM256/DUF423 family) n=1 Tax=Abyssicoccus albus TaxID=1817405 RepID=A0A3N5BBP8_9BACL|nr:DUF423 domain-containing protein [Abyssicoccus albus]RPF54837.1 uncharacterized membrane protein YgdD (TMEM256/DUF423 family) [Abyssicoccus albus]
MMKLFLILGSVFMALGVALGAFGAHGLEDKLSEKYMGIWEKAVHYHLVHALGLLIIGVIQGTTTLNVNWAGYLLTAGIILFSGSLYILALTQIKVLGAITPLGGVAFIAGWIVLMIAAIKF